MKNLAIAFAFAMMVVAGPAFAQPNLCDILPNLPQCEQPTPTEDGVNVNQDVDVDVNQFQVQEQGQVQGQSSKTGDNTVTITEDNRFPASSAASLYLGTCQAGVSAQTLQGGGSLGSPDEVCLLFTAAQVASSQNRPELATKLLDEAVDILKIRSNPVRRFLQGFPLIGRVM